MLPQQLLNYRCFMQIAPYHGFLVGIHQKKWRRSRVAAKMRCCFLLAMLYAGAYKGCNASEHGYRLSGWFCRTDGRTVWLGRHSVSIVQETALTVGDQAR